MKKGRYEYYSYKCWRPGKSFGKKRWDCRFRFANGNIFVFSRQGYNNLADMMHGINQLQDSRTAKVIEVDK